MNLFKSALLRKNKARPPVWLMRQAGRYHSHYQELRKRYSFVELCKIPEVACEATLGPMLDFDFDAAILFSDLLFPLEAMGMGLRYEEGPQLSWHLRESKDVNRLKGGSGLADSLCFQAQAIELIRNRLSPEKGLLGFVGGPLTLFCYAVEGSHKGSLASARAGLTDGRLAGFFEKLVDLLVENMLLQARAGVDVIAILDTCAGEFSASDYDSFVIPYLKILLDKFKERSPHTPLIYYSKGTGPEYWRSIKGLPIEGLGIDWKQDLVKTLTEWSSDWAIQGNVDPSWLFLDEKELEVRLRKVFEGVRALPQILRQGWICGLGHGVLPKTPEKNVKLLLKLQREIFSENL